MTHRESFTYNIIGKIHAGNKGKHAGRFPPSLLRRCLVVVGHKVDGKFAVAIRRRARGRRARAAGQRAVLTVAHGKGLNRGVERLKLRNKVGMHVQLVVLNQLAIQVQTLGQQLAQLPKQGFQRL